MYSKFIAITNQKLYGGDYFATLEAVAALKPKGIILREKELSDSQYLDHARKAASICRKEGVDLFIHSHIDIAKALGISNIHLSIPTLCQLGEEGVSSILNSFKQISVSCHSREDVDFAVSQGATRIVLGTIFETDCKPGLRGRGLEFVKDICADCPIPVYGIGGINEGNIDDLITNGAVGGCMMSGFVKAIK